MTITLKELNDAAQVLIKILNHPMNIKLAYRIRKIVSQIQAELKHLDSVKTDLIKKHGEPFLKDGKDTGHFKVSPDKLESFNKEFEDLMKEEIKTPIEKIPFESIDIPISPFEMVALDKFIEEPNEKPDSEDKKV